MADFSLGDAQLTTSVDLSGLEAGIGEAQGVAEKGGNAAGNALGAGMAAGVALAAAAVVAAVGAVVASAVSYASDQAQAVNMLQAQLGVTADEAANLGNVAEQVFLNNFGGSIAEATAAVGEVRKQLGELPDAELQDVTEGVLSIADAFGQDLPKVINTVKTLTSEFGLTGAEAMDLISTGFQQGLDSNGDFLDSIGEYSNLFAENGFAADEFFSAMQTGMAGGVLGTDKAADAFKEFGIRMQDGSTATRDALAQLGIEEVFTKISDGSMTVADAFPIVQEALASIEDPVAQTMAGVALFGTQWEDLGASAMLAIDTTVTSMGDMGGATDSLNVQYANLGAVWETMNRQMLVTISPIGEALLALANMAMPYVLAGFEMLRAGIEVAITYASGIVQSAIALISGALTGPGVAGASVWGAAFTAVQNLIGAVMTGLQGIIGAVLGIIQSFWEQNGASIMAFAQTTWNQIGQIISTAAQLVQMVVSTYYGAVASFLQTHGDTIVAVLTAAWNNIRTVISTVLSVIQSVINIALALMRGDFSTVWSEILNIVTTVIGAVQSIISTTIGAIQTVWASIFDAIQTKTSEVWDGIKTAITTAIEEAKSGVETTIQGILDYVDGLAGRALAAGEGFINNMKDGVLGAIEGLIDAAKEKLKGLTDLLPGSEPRDPTSPLRNLAARGRAIATNMIPGLEAGMGDLDSAMRDGLRAAVEVAPASGGDTYQLTANYRNQPERALRDDIRTIQLMRSI